MTPDANKAVIREVTRAAERGDMAALAAHPGLKMDRIVDGAIVLHYANVAWLDILLPLGVLPSAGALAD